MKVEKKKQWSANLPADAAREALHVAMEVASRLIKTENLKESFALSLSQSHPDRPPIWQRGSLVAGFPALATMCFQIEAYRPHQGWAECGCEFLKIVTDGLTYETREYDPQAINSLFAGLPGLGFVLLWAPQGRLKYKGVLDKIDNLLTETILTELNRMKSCQGFPINQYDLVSGLTGIGRYLLARLPDERAEKDLIGILHCFIGRSVEVDDVMQFYSLPSDSYFPENGSGRGAINCGLAHGVPGPLALMSLCVKNGINLPGLNEAIEFLADWVIAHSIEDEWGINWPYHVVVPDETEATEEKAMAARAAWCYGNPGVAWSLWLAGEALAKDEYRQIAISAMQSVYRRPASAQEIDSPTFCHGTAGLLHISARFLSASQIPLFDEAVKSLSRQLIAEFDPDLFWGYRDYSPKCGYSDDHGLLTGASGIVLTLLALLFDQEPIWDQSLLLS